MNMYECDISVSNQEFLRPSPFECLHAAAVSTAAKLLSRHLRRVLLHYICAVHVQYKKRHIDLFREQ